MSERVKIVTSFYKSIDEDARLERSRQGQLEWITTMSYIHRYADSGRENLGNRCRNRQIFHCAGKRRI